MQPVCHAARGPEEALPAAHTRTYGESRGHRALEGPPADLRWGNGKPRRTMFVHRGLSPCACGVASPGDFAGPVSASPAGEIGTSVATSRLMSESGMRILLVDQNILRASVLEEGLREAGCADVIVVRDMQNLLRRILDADPDVIFIDLANPNRDVLEQMFQVSRSVRRPIAMFVDRSDTDMIAAAVDAGVGAYVVDGLKKERVKSILELAVSRFHAFNRIRDELEHAKQALEDRKIIDRAKGILMKERSLTEEEAYALLRKAAMNENRRLAEVAQSLLTAARLLRSPDLK